MNSLKTKIYFETITDGKRYALKATENAKSVQTPHIFLTQAECNAWINYFNTSDIALEHIVDIITDNYYIG